MISTSREADILSNFLFEGSNWSTSITKRHPKLNEAYKLKTKRERRSFVRAYVVKTHRERAKEIAKARPRFEREWRKREKRFFERIAEIMGTAWPKNRPHIRADISINPICPRFLDDWSFTMSYRADPSFAMEIIMHECVHFLYFKKWKEVFPNAKRRTFDSPHIEWVLSELVAPIILNDPLIQTILKRRAIFYSEHRRVRIGKLTAPAFFTKLYRQRTDFDSFLKEAYREIKKHRKAVNSDS